MSYTIAAVIVTYNRKELLLKNILSCQEQKRLLDKIIIIDNHSTDAVSYTHLTLPTTSRV